MLSPFDNLTEADRSLALIEEQAVGAAVRPPSPSPLTVMVWQAEPGQKTIEPVIGTLTASVPAENRASITVITDGRKVSGPCDVIWLAVPPHGLTEPETASLSAVLDRNERTVVMPFLLLTPHNSTDANIRNRVSLRESLDTFVREIAAIHPSSVYPALPIGGDFDNADRSTAAYNDTLVRTIWDITLTAGLAVSLWRASFTERFDTLADSLIAPPSHVMGLLRNHSFLKQLRSLEPPHTSVSLPRPESLKELRAEGIAIYGDLLSSMTPAKPMPARVKTSAPIAEKQVEAPTVMKPSAQQAAAEKMPSAPVETPPEQIIREPQASVEKSGIKPVSGHETKPVVINAELPQSAKEEQRRQDKVASPPEVAPEPAKPKPDSRLLAAAAFLERAAGLKVFAEDSDELKTSAGELAGLAAAGPGKAPDDILALVDCLLVDAYEAFSLAEKDLARREAELRELAKPVPRKPDPDKTEALEQAEQFWHDFVPVALRKITVKKYDDEVRKLVSRERKAFDDYLALTPDIEEGFLECKNKQWPTLAKEVSKKMHGLFDDVLDLWRLSAAQQFNTLEEFRQDRFPDEPAIDCEVSISTKKRPILSDKLTTAIPRKPGIITKFLTRNSESDIWREQLISAFSLEAKEHFDHFQADSLSWLKDAYESFRKLLQSHLTASKAAAAAARRKLEALSAPAHPDEALLKKHRTILARDQAAYKSNREAVETMSKEWGKLKQELRSGPSRS